MITSGFKLRSFSLPPLPLFLSLSPLCHVFSSYSPFGAHRRPGASIQENGGRVERRVYSSRLSRCHSSCQRLRDVSGARDCRLEALVEGGSRWWRCYTSWKLSLSLSCHEPLPTPRSFSCRINGREAHSPADARDKGRPVYKLQSV